MQDRTIIQLGSPGSVRRGVRLNGMYEIETLIAQGGMGEVYKGFNIQTNDPVAIKMIRLNWPQSERFRAVSPGGVDPSQSRARGDRPLFRFFRRPRLAARLSRDGVRRRPVAGQAATAGRDLARRSQGPANRIAGALDAAHKLGVVHRDISSDNVILQGGDARPGQNDRFRHRPFSASGRRDDHRRRISPANTIMSRPSNWVSRAARSRLKSDIYSFGLVLAEALRGGRST